jgi:hypothetical protein
MHHVLIDGCQFFFHESFEKRSISEMKNAEESDFPNGTAALPFNAGMIS